MKKLLMGNEAIAWGALRAGVGFAAGYPGTPSTEILETLGKNRPEGVYVEWSVNEKAALESAAGAAYAGVRSLVTMKQVGLNVASDPLMSLAYVGVRGGMVVVVADDPGPISSQTEQDTRSFAQFCKLPVFDPCTPEEAYRMVGDAFALSEQLGSPVLLRPTTRVCHGCATVDVDEAFPAPRPGRFERDTRRWVIFPRLSYENHLKIEARNRELADTLSDYPLNAVSGAGRLGIAAGGVSYACALEAMDGREARVLRVATPHPFPERLALEFLRDVDQVLVLEELDPLIERELTLLCGRHHLNVTVRGKLTGDVPAAGELSAERIGGILDAYLGGVASPAPEETAVPVLPARPPVLCAGCPHRASFYAVKRAMAGKNAVFSGDIGCYTLGNAQPLDMVDTCLCMGAGLTIAQGLAHVDPDAIHFAFIGDSTFFASGLTGVVNAVYNQSDLVLVVLDNATTAMTGHQPHPGTGATLMGAISQKISIERVLEGIGVRSIRTVNPFDHEAAMRAVREAADEGGVRCLIFRAPCVAISRPAPAQHINAARCIGCRKCVRDLGCPAISLKDGKPCIEPSLCYGCRLCAQVCPVKAIEGGDAQ